MIFRRKRGDSTMSAEDAQLWNDNTRKDYEHGICLGICSMMDHGYIHFFAWLYLSHRLQTSPTPGLLALLWAGLISKDLKLPMASSDSTYIMTQCCKLMELSQTEQQWKVFNFFFFSQTRFLSLSSTSLLINPCSRAHWPSISQISLQCASVLKIAQFPQLFYS